MSNSSFISNIVAKVEVPLLRYMTARSPVWSMEEGNSAHGAGAAGLGWGVSHLEVRVDCRS